MKKTIFHELYERLKEPWCISFCWYLILFIFIIGGTGVWLPFVKGCNVGLLGLADNLITFSIAIIGPSLYSLLLSSSEYENKPSLFLFGFSILVCDIILLLIFYNSSLSWLIGVLNTVIAVLLWIIVNHNNSELIDSKFRDTLNANAKKLGQKW